jgi:hypothetical protein
MVVRIREIAGAADTAEQGALAHTAIQDALATEKIVSVSFFGVKTATSSFVHAAFITFLHTMSPSEFKTRLKIIESTWQINDMIRTCFGRHGKAVA